MEENNTQFVEAKKMIKNVEILQEFMKGKTYNKIINFICVLQKSVEGINKTETNISEVITYKF
jgi:hypothetical protein